MESNPVPPFPDLERVPFIPHITRTLKDGQAYTTDVKYLQCDEPFQQLDRMVEDTTKSIVENSDTKPLSPKRMVRKFFELMADHLDNLDECALDSNRTSTLISIMRGGRPRVFRPNLNLDFKAHPPLPGADKTLDALGSRSSIPPFFVVYSWSYMIPAAQKVQ